MRTRRARYVAAGNVLSPERFRSVPGTKSNRGWAGNLYRLKQTKLHRARCISEDETNRPARKARAVPNEGERFTAATALHSVSQWRADRRSNQRHTFSELELGRGNGVCLGRAREDRRANRHRNSRPKISGHYRKETALQKINIMTI